MFLQFSLYSRPLKYPSRGTSPLDSVLELALREKKNLWFFKFILFLFMLFVLSLRENGPHYSCSLIITSGAFDYGCRLPIMLQASLFLEAETLLRLV